MTLLQWGLLLVALAAVAWVVAAPLSRAHHWRRAERRSDRRPDEAACGSCGYVIAPGSSMTCPECGSDVRAVGVVTGASPRLLPAFPVYALAVLGVLPVGYWLGSVVALYQPFGWRWDAAYWVHFDAPGVGGDPGRHFIVITAGGAGRYQRQLPAVVSATAWAHDKRVLLASRWGGGGDSWCELSVTATDLKSEEWIGPLGRELVTRFVSAAGCDLDTGQGRRVVTEVEQRVRFLAVGDFPMTRDEAKVKAILPGFRVRYHLADRVERACVRLAWLVLVPGAAWAVWRYRGKRYGAAAVRNAEAVERLRLVPAAPGEAPALE